MYAALASCSLCWVLESSQRGYVFFATALFNSRLINSLHDILVRFVNGTISLDPPSVISSVHGHSKYVVEELLFARRHRSRESSLRRRAPMSVLM